MARDGLHVKVEGGKRLTSTLHDAADDLDELPHVEAAAIVANAAMAGAPRRSGRLAGSGRSQKTREGAAVSFGSPSVPYARPIHYGWPARHISPQPFLTTAAERTRPIWLLRYRVAVNRILAKVKGA